MRILSVFWKSLREQLRQPLVLSLTLLLPAMFVMLYWMFFPGGGSTSYSVLILNMDKGTQQEDGSSLYAGEDLIEELASVRYQSGDPLLSIKKIENRAEAEQKLRDRKAALLLVIPADFSTGMAKLTAGETADPVHLTIVGDLTNPYYSVAAIFCSAGLESYLQAYAGMIPPVAILEEALGDSAGRSEFEMYVPGLLIFAVVLLVFQASMVITGEVEAGTLQRLRMTRLSSFEYLFGTGLALEVIGIIALLLAFLTARLLGFESEGPLWAAVVVGGITGFAVIGSGLIVAGLTRTVSQAFLLANFPLVLFMFFTNVIYPVPAVPLFTVGTHTVNLFEILPPTHAVIALNKIFSFGVGIDELAYELTMLLVLSVLYLWVGVALFDRVHLKGNH
ncbi:MAG: ABC transporter permease [Anaerolineales bacterium]|nr:ABC transporter permease [Anaerolineales bacterium]